ncbi:hypothetical protein [Peribacillus kribbensis]|uniref:hypothetical protein n=1 Tax=Peribacillus kribbensis TaxID=356658 RepID=UPI000406BB31|nr:hypothetical protein [Peribacillus kribbensis]
MDIRTNEEELRKIFKEEVVKYVKGSQSGSVIWDSRELEKQTSMSLKTIQKTFFKDPRMPKYKIGNKWYFPAEETRLFLLTWIKEK